MSHVLIVDDEAAMRAALEANFLRRGWRVRTAAGVGEAIEKFRSAPSELVVTDMRMPDGDGLQVMQGVRTLAPETPVILLTAYGSVPDAVQAIKEGACDYLQKPVCFDQLEAAAERILGRNAEEADGGEPEIIGNSPELRSAIARARRVAQTDADILVQAESGTGKELIARMIHRQSRRAAGPFVAVNCAAFPDNLLESELFGHVKGAFTGATLAKPGKFELAHNGTLLLDEIGEMPLSLQPKLLRVLQEREVDRLGGIKPVHFDVRVIATTNRNLAEEVENGEFRADLYYRLHVVPLGIPPLRERRGDIRELSAHFLRKHESKAQRGLHRISEELAALLEAHDWPGNIRELENFVRRALALTHSATLGPELFETAAGAAPVQRAKALPSGGTLQEMEKQLLEATLRSTGGNRTRAAELMGISLRTVRNKIREYGLPARRSA